MDPIGLLIVAVVIVAIVMLVARRSRGDQPGDRGSYSSAMETRGGMAALGGTIDEPPQGAKREPGESGKD